MELKNEKGITLMALAITVILITIIGAFSLNIVNNSTKSSEDAREFAELRMVQQAILERYTKYTLTKDVDVLVGDKITYNNTTNPLLSHSTLPDQFLIFDQMEYRENMPAEECYYILYNDTNNPDDENRQLLKKIGIENTSNVYLVNYYTGEAMQLETEIVKNGMQNGKYGIAEFENQDPNLTEYIVLKEDNERYVIKQTSGGNLLYTYVRGNIS